MSVRRGRFSSFFALGAVSRSNLHNQSIIQMISASNFLEVAIESETDLIRRHVKKIQQKKK